MTAVSVHVFEVAGNAEAVAEALSAAGHTVSGPVKISAGDVPGAVAGLVGVQMVVAVGVGTDLVRATLEGGVTVCRIPGDPISIGLAIERFLLPGLAAWTLPDDVELEPDSIPEPVPFQTARRAGLGVAMSQNASNSPEDPEDEKIEPGWKSAIQILKGEIDFTKREELPQPIESLSPVVNVLETAGEQAVLELPNGRKYGLYGWPDLRRGSSRVLAVGWGNPLAEILALHRHPSLVGTVIAEEGGVISREPVAEIAFRLTGRRPPSDSGVLFAISGETVWILRGSRVIRWDGSKERDDGSPKQVLATLALNWSNR